MNREIIREIILDIVLGVSTKPHDGNISLTLNDWFKLNQNISRIFSFNLPIRKEDITAWTLGEYYIIVTFSLEEYQHFIYNRIKEPEASTTYPYRKEILEDTDFIDFLKSIPHPSTMSWY